MRVVCKILRGENTESVHEVYAVAIDREGKIIFKSGDPHYVTCVRSSLKPFQAGAVVSTGATDKAGFTEEEIALMCASHNGEKIHADTAESMMRKLGYPISTYECGIHPPLDKQTKQELEHQQTPFTPLFNNCSGKHAGMLSLVKYINGSPEGYTKPDHPAQKHILKKISEYAELEQFPVAIDGCSAPTPFLSLYNLALMFRKIAGEEIPELERVWKAMTNHPYNIGGRNRFDTDFIRTLNGRAITKVGGEAVQGIALRTSSGPIGIAIKVLDGNQRALHPTTMAILKQMDLFQDEKESALKKYETPELKNHRGIVIGKILTEFE